jgi:hypothetical protein
MSRLLPASLRPAPAAVTPQAEDHDWIFGPDAVGKFFQLDVSKEGDKRKLYRLKYRTQNPAPIYTVPVHGLSARRSQILAWLDQFAATL